MISSGEKFTILAWLADGLVNTSIPEPNPERSSVIRTVKVIFASLVVTSTIEGARVTPTISGGVVSPPDGVGIGVLVGIRVGVAVGKGIGVGVGMAVGTEDVGVAVGRVGIDVGTEGVGMAVGKVGGVRVGTKGVGMTIGTEGMGVAVGTVGAMVGLGWGMDCAATVASTRA